MSSVYTALERVAPMLQSTSITDVSTVQLPLRCGKAAGLTITAVLLLHCTASRLCPLQVVRLFLCYIAAIMLFCCPALAVIFSQSCTAAALLLHHRCTTAAPLLHHLTALRLSFLGTCSCRQMVEKVASEGTVMVTWANFHYLDFTMNWVQHVRAANISAYLVGAMDNDLLQALVQRGVNCFAMESGLSTGDFGWGSKQFHKMVTHLL